MKELEAVLQSDATLDYLKTHKSTFQYIADNTGKPINKLSMVVDMDLEKK